MSNAQTAIARKANGQWPKGVSGNTGGAGGRARRELNNDTIREMHAAFRRGGREVIDKVMRQQPAAFLKLLVLLVPRELEVTRSGGLKSMSDEQIEAAIEVITDMLAKREAGENARVIEDRVEELPGKSEGSPPPVKCT
jgi:hypothetical protein